MRADAPLVEPGTSVRSAVRLAPALARGGERILAAGAQVRTRIRAGPVVEAGIIPVVRNCQQRLRRTTRRQIGELVDLVAVDHRAEGAAGDAPGERGVGVGDGEVRLVDGRVEVRGEAG